MTWIAAPRLRWLAAGVVLSGVLGGCSDSDGGLDPAEFAGEWEVSMVVGGVDADPGADPATFPGDATFREHWVIDSCDDTSCVLHRPDGGLLLGDLDDVRFELTAGGVGDDEERFVAEGDASAVPRGGGHPEPGEGEEHGDGEEGGEAEEADDHDDQESATEACIGSPAQRWSVRIEVGVRDEVLSGTVIRTPETLRTQVGDTSCFGLDLTIGFSGVPRATEDASEGG
jgi:hypothetical protein